MVLALVPLPTDATDAASCRDSTCACLCAVVRGRGGVPISVELVRRLPLSVPPGEVDVGPPPTSAADAIPHKQRTLPNRRHARRQTPRRLQRARRQRHPQESNTGDRPNRPPPPRAGTRRRSERSAPTCLEQMALHWDPTLIFEERQQQQHRSSARSRNEYHARGRRPPSIAPCLAASNQSIDRSN